MVVGRAASVKRSAMRRNPCVRHHKIRHNNALTPVGQTCINLGLACQGYGVLNPAGSRLSLPPAARKTISWRSDTASGDPDRLPGAAGRGMCEERPLIPSNNPNQQTNARIHVSGRVALTQQCSASRAAQRAPTIQSNVPSLRQGGYIAGESETLVHTSWRKHTICSQTAR